MANSRILYSYFVNITRDMVATKMRTVTRNDEKKKEKISQQNYIIAIVYTEIFASRVAKNILDSRLIITASPSVACRISIPTSRAQSTPNSKIKLAWQSATTYYTTIDKVARET